MREVFGYDRIDNKELVWMMNVIYDRLFNPLYNFFIPQLKSVQKTRVGSKYIRKYDKPKTPYQRLLESESVTEEQKEKLKRTYESLNPILLRKQLAKEVSAFKTYVKIGIQDFGVYTGNIIKELAERLLKLKPLL